mgnify:CR=1 FL=1
MPDSIVGRPLDRIDGHAKVTGGALYSADHGVDDLAHGHIVTATIAHGQIKAIDTAAAEPERFNVQPAWVAQLGRYAEGQQHTLGAYDRPWR